MIDQITTKQIQQAKDNKQPKPMMPKHHSGKGTQARINTAAEKHFFKSKVSK